MLYDIIIIGGGPAGAGAAVYAGRKRLKTLLITESFGGQSITSDDIQNWIGTKSISGFELAQKMEEHVRAQETVKIKMPDKVVKIEESGKNFSVTAASGEKFETKALIVAAGARRRRLKVPGEDKLEGKGVAYCSTCDAPLFGGKTVAVVGGGNAALEAAVDLFPYAVKIYLVVRGDTLRGDQITQEKVKASDKVEIRFNSEIQEIRGDKFVQSALIKDNKTGQAKELKLEGIFVEIGSVPNSEIAQGLLEINQFGEIIIDHKKAATSRPGIFAAGDITDEMYKQNNISAGDGVRAALSAYNYILALDHKSPAAEKPNGQR